MVLFPDSMMNIRSLPLEFPNAAGAKLAARLELPAIEKPRAYALFAHCFTCSKDLKSASWITRTLAAKGLAVLRFDFTGLGGSDGDFCNTNFSSNIADLIAAADYLRSEYRAPQLLVGHSLGGAAVLAAAHRIPETRAVCTIAAPSDPEHVLEHIEHDRDKIEREGKARVTIAGREFTLKKEFIEDVSSRNLLSQVQALKSALLIFHSPVDSVVGIDNAREIYEAAPHPKSFISLDEADHLLMKVEDARYVAETLAAWATRYLDLRSAQPTRPELSEGEVLVWETDGSYTQEIFTQHHNFLADEPESVAGARDLGPSPYEILLASLGSCTSMTLRMYAQRKGLKLEKVRVLLQHQRIHANDCEECESQTGYISRIKRKIMLEGDLSDAEQKRLMEIADMCPVHRTLTSEIRIESELIAPRDAGKGER